MAHMLYLQKKYEERVIVGLDFGTACSTTVWSVADKRDLHESISCAPSELAFKPGEPRSEAWGHQAAYGMIRYTGFKASLEIPEGISSPETYRASGFSKHKPHNAVHSADKLVVDYLRCLRIHTENDIAHEAPRLSELPVEYALAVPSRWSDDSRNKLVECARDAGMTILRDPVLEVHAAAYAQKVPRPDIERTRGDITYVMCDAGAKSVELVSFIYNPRPRFPQHSPGIHGNCGGNALNTLFERYLRTKLSGSAGWSEGTHTAAMEFFENYIKRKFGGDDNAIFEVPVPGMDDNQDLNVETSVHRLSGTELHRIMSPVFDEVVSLVKRQIKQIKGDIHSFILVGGFAENPLFYKYITSIVPSYINVVKPDSASTAVATGALVMARCQDGI